MGTPVVKWAGVRTTGAVMVNESTETFRAGEIISDWTKRGRQAYHEGSIAECERILIETIFFTVSNLQSANLLESTLAL